MNLIGKALDENQLVNTRPHLEWQWGRLVIHGGSIKTKAQCNELIELLGLFVTRLPEPLHNDPTDPNDPVPPEDDERPFGLGQAAASRSGAP